MNISYKIKFSSHPKPVTEEIYKISRLVAVDWLEKLNAKKDLHVGELKLKTFLLEAIAKTGCRKITITLKK